MIFTAVAMAFFIPLLAMVTTFSLQQAATQDAIELQLAAGRLHAVREVLVEGFWQQVRLAAEDFMVRHVDLVKSWADGTVSFSVLRTNMQVAIRDNALIPWATEVESLYSERGYDVRVTPPGTIHIDTPQKPPEGETGFLTVKISTQDAVLDPWGIFVARGGALPEGFGEALFGPAGAVATAWARNEPFMYYGNGTWGGDGALWGGCEVRLWTEVQRPWPPYDWEAT